MCAMMRRSSHTKQETKMLIWNQKSNITPIAA